MIVPRDVQLHPVADARQRIRERLHLVVWPIEGHAVVRRDAEREHRSRSEELPAGGVFLVTGGLGGLGLSLADRLAREIPGARLVLLGRSGLPGRETWAEIAKGVQGAQDARQAHVIRRILAMEEAGAEVEACAADVTHLDEMRAAISGML